MGDLGNLQGQFGELESKYTNLGTQFDTQAKNLLDVTGERNTLQGSLDKVSGLYSNLTGDYDDLDQAYTNLSVRSSALPAARNASFQPLTQPLQGASTSGILLPTSYNASQPLLFEQLLQSYQPSFPNIVPTGTPNPFVV